MPAVSSHIIGTMALIIFAATLTVYMYTVVSDENVSLTSRGLQTISDYVAVRAVKLISLANMTNTQSCIQTSLDLPITIAGGGYFIFISNASGYSITASTAYQPFVSVESMIPMNSISINVQLISTDGLIIGGVKVVSKVYGGIDDAVIWTRRIGNIIQIGLGRRL